MIVTNREWYIDKITKMSDEELAHFIEGEDNPWCSDSCMVSNCEKCMCDWLKKEYIEQMPELKVGMFVEADNGFGAEVGIITVDDDDNMIVVYFTRGWDFVRNVTINKIYKARCQGDCDSHHIIWKKS